MTRRVVLITGCGSGIGLAIAEAFAAAGWRVVATSRSHPPSEALSDLVRRSDGLVGTATLDVTDDDDRAAALRDVVAAHDRLDALVNNAGVLWVGELEQVDATHFASVLATNVIGPLDLTRRAVPHLAQSGRGRVINVSAIAGVLPAPYLSLYAASKHALEGLSASLDIELVPHGVRVLTLQPGLVRTGMLRRRRASDAADGSERLGSTATAWLDRLDERTEAHAVDPSEVAGQVVALTEVDDPPQKTISGSSRASLRAVVEHLATVTMSLRDDHRSFLDELDRSTRAPAE